MLADTIARGRREHPDRMRPVIPARMTERWRAEAMQQFIRFLNQVEAAVPAAKVVHAVVDNYATHKHPKVRAWLARHPAGPSTSRPPARLGSTRWRASSRHSPRLKRGVFSSLVGLQAAINRFVAEHNKHPKPFTWTADSDRLLTAIAREKHVLESLH